MVMVSVEIELLKKLHANQEPAIPAFSIPIPILRLFQCLVDFDTDSRKSENFDSDFSTDTWRIS